MSSELTGLPADLPVPVDDGAADHLRGAALPSIALPATDTSTGTSTGTTGASTGNREIRLDLAPPDGARRWVVYAYPRTGVPGEEPLTPDWDTIPGARGCTPESCGFRDHAEDLRAVGAAVAGLSTQDTAYQEEMARRLRLPFPVLSDHDLRLTRALRLPTFDVAGQTLLRRLTMVIEDGVVEHVFYPVFPPDTHADTVLRWLVDHRRH